MQPHCESTLVSHVFEIAQLESSIRDVSKAGSVDVRHTVFCVRENRHPKCALEVAQVAATGGVRTLQDAAYLMHFAIRLALQATSETLKSVVLECANK